MDQARDLQFVAVKAYTIPGRGVVVTGRVEKGSVSVGDEIGLLGTDGNYISATVTAIEVARRLVETAEAGAEASLLLQGIKKDQVPAGTVLTSVPGGPPAPVAPSPSGPDAAPSYETASTPSTPSPYSLRPIHPSSSSWRTVVLIIIGALILLLLAMYEGKWDPRKLDPKKWDPRKRLTGKHVTVLPEGVFFETGTGKGAFLPFSE